MSCYNCGSNSFKVFEEQNEQGNTTLVCCNCCSLFELAQNLDKKLIDSLPRISLDLTQQNYKLLADFLTIRSKFADYCTHLIANGFSDANLEAYRIIKALQQRAENV